MNKITLIGNLTKDIEIKHTPKGSVANGTIAVTRDYNREITDFVNFTLWNKTAETAAKYVGKGSKVAIHGSLHIDKNNDKLYTSVSVENIEFLTPKTPTDSKEPPKYKSPEIEKMKESVEDLPF